jgi:DNA-binding CsgD family transcriptional regulator
VTTRFIPRLGDAITARELQVLDLVSQGLTNAAIGRALGISEGTVKTHLSHVGAKFGCGDRAGLVGIAYRSGLLAVRARAS